MAGVNIYRVLSVKGFYVENIHLRTCNMFTLKHFRNKICNMEHLLPTKMDKAYPEQLVNIMSTGVAAVVTKPEG